MGNDALQSYMEMNEPELMEKFINHKKLAVEFEMFCFEEWKSHVADEQDIAYEMVKDSKIMDGQIP